MGVEFDIPTVGCAKKTFDVDGLHKGNIKELCAKNLLKGGDAINLTGNSGKVWASALRSTE